MFHTPRTILFILWLDKNEKKAEMIHLHLLRHAKTEQFSPTGRDFDRPLMRKGTQQAEELNHFFQTLHSIDNVLCSSAVRTRQTLDAIAWNGMPTPDFREDLYLCSHGAMLKLLWSEGFQGDVLIVGHNLGLSDLANYFTDGYLELRTGGYVRIAFDVDSWEETSRGMGVIAEAYRPEV